MDELYSLLLKKLIENAPSIVLFVVLFGWNVKRYIINGMRQRWIDYHDEMLIILRNIEGDVRAWKQDR